MVNNARRMRAVKNKTKPNRITFSNRESRLCRIYEHKTQAFGKSSKTRPDAKNKGSR